MASFQNYCTRKCIKVLGVFSSKRTHSNQLLFIDYTYYHHSARGIRGHDSQRAMCCSFLNSLSPNLKLEPNMLHFMVWFPNLPWDDSGAFFADVQAPVRRIESQLTDTKTRRAVITTALNGFLSELLYTTMHQGAECILIKKNTF